MHLLYNTNSDILWLTSQSLPRYLPGSFNFVSDEDLCDQNVEQLQSTVLCEMINITTANSQSDNHLKRFSDQYTTTIAEHAR